MVYCPRCRNEAEHMLGLDVPLEDIDVEGFVALYRDERTESDPGIAAGIVFGQPLPEAVVGAQQALAARRVR